MPELMRGNLYWPPVGASTRPWTTGTVEASSVRRAVLMRYLLRFARAARCHRLISRHESALTWCRKGRRSTFVLVPGDRADRRVVA